MFVGPRRLIRTFAWIVLVAIFTALTAWCAGFFYWQLTLSAAVRHLHSQIAELKRQPPEELEHLHQFNRAMSRGVPVLLQETGRALSNQDKVAACILIHYLSMAVAHADYHGEFELHPSPHIRLRSFRESLEDLRIAHRINCDWWESNRANYPPWWMWWSGSRRAP